MLSRAWMEVAMTHTPGEAASGTDVVKARPWYRQLYVQVLVAIVVGIVLGWRWPDLGTSMEPIEGDILTSGPWAGPPSPTASACGGCG
jgi:hypothetical protein